MKYELTEIGSTGWTRDAMRSQLEEFARLYEKRPIKDNYGGMSSTHLFLFWFVLRQLRPTHVIESGVWKGQGTWLIEQTVPEAKIYSIDINFRNLVYRSSTATYLDRDFRFHDWSALPKETTLGFFDDHVNAVQRLKQIYDLGFRHAIFEDNYPPGKGSDVYSLKMAFMHSGLRVSYHWRAIAGRLIGTRSDRSVKPNALDEAEIRKRVDVYQEMPPIFKLESHRSGPWDHHLPTPEPLLTRVTRPYEQVFLNEATWYTWLAYVRLKRHATNSRD